MFIQFTFFLCNACLKQVEITKCSYMSSILTPNIFENSGMFRFFVLSKKMVVYILFFAIFHPCVLKFLEPLDKFPYKIYLIFYSFFSFCILENTIHKTEHTVYTVPPTIEIDVNGILHKFSKQTMCSYCDEISKKGCGGQFNRQ